MPCKPSSNGGGPSRRVPTPSSGGSVWREYGDALDEGVSANGVRLRELGNKYSGRAWDEARYEAACAEIDELERPEAEAIERHFAEKMKRVEELTEQLNAMLRLHGLPELNWPERSQT